MPETAEKVFAATEAELAEQARAVVADEPILAAGAFWPNGVTRETIEHGTVGGRHLGAIVGPNLGAMAALAGAFSGLGDDDPDRYALAQPFIVAVTASHIHVIEPAVDGAPVRSFLVFDRATTVVTIKHRGLSRLLVLDDADHDQHFRLLGAVNRLMKRSGPDTSVFDALAGHG